MYTPVTPKTKATTRTEDLTAKRNQTAAEMSEVYFERAREASTLLCQRSNELAENGDLTNDDMMELADRAEELSLMWRTAAVLDRVISMPGECPSCGYDLISHARDCGRRI